MFRKRSHKFRPVLALFAAAAPFAAVHAAEAQRAHLFGSPENWELVESYCMECHNSDDWFGQLAFDAVDREQVGADPALWEKVVRKLRAGMMPPPGSARPENARVD